ncbi:MAG: hypothetical protein H0X37_15765 [Herpetosiphonaceae bacterium]|nr:hypothetical protein [Herpetosiphonaceae bacterium]
MAQIQQKLRQAWHEQRGSNVAEAAAVALLSALLISVLLVSSRDLVPPVQHAFGCVIGVLGGGGACATSGSSSGGSSGHAAGDKPWWEKLWEGIGKGWDWLFKHVLSPVGDFFKNVWNWLTEEHTWTWWKDFLDNLSKQGWLGFIASGILGFAMDLLFGIGSDGKFRWGMVIFATATTILSIFGVGLLAKIPIIGRLFEAGGLLAKAFTWFKELPWVDKFLTSKFGAWLTKLGSQGIADLLQGKWGQVLVNLGKALGKIPVIGPILKAIEDNKIVKTLGNYVWRLLTHNYPAIVGDVIKTILKDVLQPKADTPLEKAIQIAKRLFVWKGLRDIIKWVLKPKFPFPW